MQTTFTIDKEIRDKAAKRAKSDKLSVSTVARLLLKDYADGKISIGSRISDVSVTHVEDIEVDDEIQAKMDDVVKAFRKRKGQK